MPPAGVATSGVPEASASSTVFGRPSTLPLSSRTDGTTATSAAANQPPTCVLRQVAEEADAIGHAGGRGARAQLAGEIARRRRSPAALSGRSSSGSASIRYSNPFFRTRRPAAKTSGASGGDAEARPQLGARVRRRA